MAVTETKAETQGLENNGETRRQGLIATGGILGALAMSSCCILPLVLFSLGITGAWIGNLAALYPYKAYFFVATAGFLVAGFYGAYRKPKVAACEGDGYCGTPISGRINKAALWMSTVLVLAALAFPYYAPLLLDS
jgi:mercuric ion transport protein